MNKLRLLGAALLATIVCTAHAQSMKPGLWEISGTMKSASGAMEKAMAEAQKQMAAMPPEQRKMMQDMMAKSGMSMGTGGVPSVRICMTQDMVARNAVPQQQQGDCKTTNGARTGNSMEMSFVCTSPPSSGKGRFTILGPEGYTSQMTTTTTAGGKAEQMDITSTGKWISADCGAIQPVPMPRQQ